MQERNPSDFILWYKYVTAGWAYAVVDDISVFESDAKSTSFATKWVPCRTAGRPLSEDEGFECVCEADLVVLGQLGMST